VRSGQRPRLRLGALIGSGDRIGAFVLPFVVAGVTRIRSEQGSCLRQRLVIEATANV
jgi:hypothetical protein